jgi:hypothetical protein
MGKINPVPAGQGPSTFIHVHVHEYVLVPITKENV